MMNKFQKKKQMLEFGKLERTEKAVREKYAVEEVGRWSEDEKRSSSSVKVNPKTQVSFL